MAIVRYSKPSRDILWSSENFLQQSISLNSCETATYGIPINTREDQFNPHVAAFLLEKNALHFGDVMRKRPRDVIDIHKLGNGPIDFVRMSLPPRGDFEWAFSRESLAATSITTTRYGESNLLGILDLMAQAGNVRSEDILSRLVTHPLHFVRWRAVRSLVQLNADRGTHYLQIAVNDPHPEVKAAAIKSLELACSRLEERKVVS